MIMYEAPLNLLLLFKYSNHHSAYLLPPYLPDAVVYNAYPIVVSHAVVHPYIIMVIQHNMTMYLGVYAYSLLYQPAVWLASI